MPVFNIQRPLGLVFLDERGRYINELELNDEWTILCVLLDSQGVVSCKMVDSMEIHRKNTAGKFLVSGELTISNEKDGPELHRIIISELIEKGSSFKEICLNLYSRNIIPIYFIKGFLNISEVDEKQPTNLANKESKERILLNSFEELSKHFEKLLSPESSSADVRLKCDSVSIPAHKNILSARSPVFATMFTTPMIETLKNEVDITDIDVSTLRALLKYIYTGRTYDLTPSSAADLLFAADKYQLQDLKAVCTHFLKETMSDENMWKILVLGDMHSEDLKSFAVDYIHHKSGKFSVLKNTQEWKELRKERPDLAIDLLELLMK